MKKILKFAFLFWGHFLIFFCQTNKQEIPEGACLVSLDPGWLNNHSFQLRSLGQAGKAVGFVKRRTVAEENALLCAQWAASELMLNPKNRIILHPEEAKKKTIPQNLVSYIRGGHVVKKNFDDQENCEIFFRIEGENLRQIAEKSFY